MLSDQETRLIELMQRYQGGDENAFAELYSLTAPSIERYLRRWVDSTKAGDLLQETYLQMHRARRTYRPELPFRPWMYALARHVAQQSLRTYMRRGAREIQPDENFEIEVASEEGRLATRDELDRALERLPREQREAVWLAEVEGLTSAEIARVTGATEGAVRVRIHRANQKLRTWLRPAADSGAGGG